MAAENPPHVEVSAVRDVDADAPDSVLMRPNPVSAIARAAGSATALALTALIVATATMLNMSAANDIADAKLYSSRGLNDLAAIRWVAGTRLIVAGVALLLALLAGVRYSRGQPAIRYTFSEDGEEATESSEGADAPAWVSLLVGSAVAVSLLALLLNGLAWALTLHLHESPNFGLPPG
jgi:multisubunit Na+/H+ antiporter MnhB subunit